MIAHHQSRNTALLFCCTHTPCRAAAPASQQQRLAWLSWVHRVSSLLLCRPFGAQVLIQATSAVGKGAGKGLAVGKARHQQAQQLRAQYVLRVVPAGRIGARQKLLFDSNCR